MNLSSFSSKPSAWFKTKVFPLSLYASLILLSFTIISCSDKDSGGSTQESISLKLVNSDIFPTFDNTSGASVGYVESVKTYEVSAAAVLSHNASLTAQLYYNYDDAENEWRKDELTPNIDSTIFFDNDNAIGLVLASDGAFEEITSDPTYDKLYRNYINGTVINAGIYKKYDADISENLNDYASSKLKSEGFECEESLLNCSKSVGELVYYWETHDDSSYSYGVALKSYWL
jgi:hypothetical protein